MSTTGVGQAQDSIARGAGGVEVERQPEQDTDGTLLTPQAPADCPVCGDVEAEPIAVCSDFERPPTADAFLALVCSDCGSVYLSPAPATADPPLRAVKLTAPTGGGLTRAGRHVARRAAGLDPTRILVLSRQGDTVFDLGRLGLEPPQVVILDGALEHSRAPLTLLATVREGMDPGGQIILILKNLASPSFAIFGGRHWAGYDFPRQRALYSIDGIRRLARRIGLDIRSISTVADPSCWIESVRRALTDWRASGWLIRRFGSTSIVSRAAFGMLEGVFQWRRRGAVLVVSLGQAPDPVRKPAPPPPDELV